MTSEYMTLEVLSPFSFRLKFTSKVKKKKKFSALEVAGFQNEKMKDFLHLVCFIFTKEVKDKNEEQHYLIKIHVIAKYFSVYSVPG